MRRDLLAIVDGTAQTGRLADGLRDHYFDVDERSFEELIARSAELAKYIHYYDGNNSRRGSWKKLFDSDEALVLADIITTDTARMERQYLAREKDAAEVATYLAGFARHIDRWYRRLNEVDEDASRVICRQIEAVISSKLRDSLRHILLTLRQAPAKDASAESELAHEFHSVWSLPADKTNEPAMGAQQMHSTLRIAFYSMVSAVAYLKPIAAERLKQSLTNGNHDPAVGLLLACVRLISAAQERLNQFSSRHRDFYYGRVLLMRPKPQVLDSTFLVFQLNLNAPPILIPKGTAFTAGKLEGQGEIIYETVSPVVVSDIKIQKIITLHCSRSASVSPEWELGYIDGVHTADLLPMMKNPSSAQSALSWPIFGGELTAEIASGEADAQVGFAIASSVLRLSEGDRSINVEVTFQVAQPSADSAMWFQEEFRSLLFGYQSTNELVDGYVRWLGDFKGQIDRVRRESASVPGRKANPSVLDDEPASYAALEQASGEVDGFRHSLQELKSNVIQGSQGLPEQLAGFEQRIDALLQRSNSPSLLASFRSEHQGFRQALEELAERLSNFAKEAQKRGVNENDLIMQDPDYVFHVILQSAFIVSITAEKGWYEFSAYSVSAPTIEAGRVKATFSMTIGPEGPPVSAHSRPIHKGGFAEELPVLRFDLNPRADVYAYSLFDGLLVEEIEIETEVKGANRIVAWNQFGQLDPSKPFTPFGPLPTTNSYLVVGHYEAAAMRLTELSMQIEWGDLPGLGGGFGEYYQSYGSDFSNDAFLARVSVLRDGRWRPLPEEKSTTTRLFDGGRESAVSDTRTIPVSVLHWFKPIDPSVSVDRFRYDQKARDGFFRIELIGPERAFGHREYPYLLTAAVAENARRKRFHAGPGDLPNPPYTPTINRISLSYRAVASIRTGNTQRGPYEDTVYRLSPFGLEQADTVRAWDLLPRLDHDGNLLIGLSSVQPPNCVTLLFHLREDSATKIVSDPEPVTWWYLVSNEWRRLEENRVVSDSTSGFLSSGIIMLDLPADIDRNNSVMPDDYYWIRASTSRICPSFCSMYSIETQAAPAVRRLTATAPSVLKAPLPPGSIKAPMTAIPGLREVTQPIASFGGREQETQSQLVTRTAERLRHKGRAVTPWDYERLVLEAFPEVFKVKCFSCMSSTKWTKPNPGSVLIVVVPQQPIHKGGSVFDPLLDANRLKAIAEYIRQRASPQIKVEVRNPSYERILVRCSVGFKDPQDPEGWSGRYAQGRGFWLRQLNQDLVDYLSPWSDIGPPPRFGWSFQLEEVQAYIRSLPYIRAVTSFSMLHLTQSDDGFYRLQDTARVEISEHIKAPGAPGNVGDQKIVPRYPWSLAIPNGTNILHNIDEPESAEEVPQPTGIGELGIGDIFTVRGQGHDAAKS